VFYGRPIFWLPLPHNADRFNAFKKRIDVRQSLIETNLVQLFMKVAYSGSHKGASTANNSRQRRTLRNPHRKPPYNRLHIKRTTQSKSAEYQQPSTWESLPEKQHTKQTQDRQSKTYNGHTKHQSNSTTPKQNKPETKNETESANCARSGVLTRTRVRFALIGFQKG